MATVEQTMLKVQRLLTGPMGLRVMVEGDQFHIRFQDMSTAVFVQVKDWGTNKDGDAETLVHVWSWVLVDVKPSPELFKWVAKEGGRWMGHVRVVGDEVKGNVDLVLTHALQGDFLDQRELENAVFGVLTTADQLDDELQKKFGGKRWSEA